MRLLLCLLLASSLTACVPIGFRSQSLPLVQAATLATA
jgi:hypothetical protein